MNRRDFLVLAGVGTTSAKLLEEALSRPRVPLRPMLNLDHVFPKIESTYGAPGPALAPLLRSVTLDPELTALSVHYGGAGA